MSTCYEIFRLSIGALRVGEESEADGVETESASTLSDEGMEALERVLKPNGVGIHDFFMRLDVNLNRGDFPMPWAIIVFDKDYPMADHVKSLRSSSSKLGLMSYEYLKDPSNAAATTLVSVVFVFDRAELARVGPSSPFLLSAWRELEKLDPNRSWLCLSEQEKAMEIYPNNYVVFTDPVSVSTDDPQSLATRDRESVPPIVVGSRDGAIFLILDGNHRALHGGITDTPVEALYITCDEDRDELLRLECEGKIPRFPHRNFLQGKENLADVVNRALDSAIQAGFRTMEDLIGKSWRLQFGE